MTITPSSELRLCNVAFLIDYKDTIDFSDQTAQANYFIGKTIANGNMGDEFSYIRQNNSIKVPIEIDLIRNCNYVMYKNDLYANKYFYAFVTDLRYVNPNTTELFISTDVFQTWQFDITFKQSFIERCHVDRWNADGSPVINTQDENLNYGSEYDVVDVGHWNPQGSVYFLVIVTKRLFQESTKTCNPMVNGMIQPLSFYIHPFDTNGNSPTTYIGTTNINISPLKTTLQDMYESTDSINNIVSIYVTENIGYNVNYDGAVHLSSANFEVATVGNSVTIGVKSLANYSDTTTTFVDKYANYNDVYNESKLLMYPYTQLVLTDLKGNQVNLKNEYINSKDIKVVSKGSLGTSNKTSYHIESYLQDSTMPNAYASALEHAIINHESNDVPIITDLLSAYLQGNKNSIANQKAQIHFNQNYGALMGAANAIQQGVGGATTGAATGGIIGGTVGGVTGALSAIPQTMKSYYDQEFALRGIMAKQKDIANVPPSLSTLGNNTYYDYGNDLNGVFIIKKQIKLEYIAQLADYFKMFGYRINKKRTPDFKSREHFNYIKTKGITILGNVPQNDLNQIKEIFNNGVTVWHGDWVGDYSKVNNEI